MLLRSYNIFPNELNLSQKFDNNELLSDNTNNIQIVPNTLSNSYIKNKELKKKIQTLLQKLDGVEKKSTSKIWDDIIYRGDEKRIIKKKDLIIPQGYHKAVADQYAIETYGSRIDNSRYVRFGNDKAFGGGGINLNQQTINTNMAFRDVYLASVFSDKGQHLGATVDYKNYGVSIFKDYANRYATYEILARGVENATLISQTDREYGQRIKVRDFDILVSHDFDDWLMPNSSQMNNGVLADPSTVFYLNHKALSLSAHSNRSQKNAGVGLGLGNVVGVTAEIDADQREALIAMSLANAWNAEAILDFPDYDSDRLYFKLGMGSKHVYIGAGAGITKDGLPEFSTTSRVGRTVTSTDWIFDPRHPERMIATHTIGFGKYVYSYEGHAIPQNISKRIKPFLKNNRVQSLVQNLTMK